MPAVLGMWPSSVGGERGGGRRARGGRVSRGLSEGSSSAMGAKLGGPSKAHSLDVCVFLFAGVSHGWGGGVKPLVLQRFRGLG